MTTRTIGTTSVVRLLGAWRGRGPAYRHLADGLRLLVLDGRLPVGARLPGERELAVALGVSRTTVTAAFAQLRDDGFLVSRHGSGSRTALPGDPPVRRDDGGGPGAYRTGPIDLATASLPAGEAVHGAYAHALEALPAHLPGHGYEPVGLQVLREAVAQGSARRGLPTDPGQILVTHGAQHALALLLRLVTSPGDRVLVDHPTYPHAIDAVLRASCRVVPVALDDGWDVEGITAALRQTGPRLAYLVADFHNPTGRVMAADTRARVAAAAADTRTLLVVDETMVDLWFDTPPPRPLAAHGSAAHGSGVVTLGSTGKNFWGGLRVGWIRADPGTVAALTAVRSSIDLGTPVLEQLAVAHLLVHGDAALAARRELLRHRRDHLLGLLAVRLPGWTCAVPDGGVSLWVELPAAASTALAATAARHGLTVTAGPRFGVDGAFERRLRIPFTRPEEVLTEAVERLAAAWADVVPGETSSAQSALSAPLAVAL